MLHSAGWLSVSVLFWKLCQVSSWPLQSWAALSHHNQCGMSHGCAKRQKLLVKLQTWRSWILDEVKVYEVKVYEVKVYEWAEFWWFCAAAHCQHTVDDPKCICCQRREVSHLLNLLPMVRVHCLDYAQLCKHLISTLHAPCIDLEYTQTWYICKCSLCGLAMSAELQHGWNAAAMCLQISPLIFRSCRLLLVMWSCMLGCMSSVCPALYVLCRPSLFAQVYCSC